MPEKQQFKTGYIVNGDEKILFFENEYRFTFLRIENNFTKINSIDDFIFGKLHDSGMIAISCNLSSIQMSTKKELQAWSYVTSKEINIKENPYFDMIEFRGGSLNKLFVPSALEVEHKGVECNCKYNQDSCIYQVTINDEMYEIEIGSCISEYMGIERRGIKNEGIYLRIKFEKMKPIKEAYFHYQKIKELLAFMTYRENVGFDEILLYQGNTFKQMRKMVLCINETYEVSKKDVIHNINFHDLNNRISPLLKLLYESSDKKVSYSFGFFPRNESDVNRITSDKIRAICSALECEISLVDGIKVEEDENLKRLIKQVKEVISSHKKSEDPLQDKTYSQIYRNIQHWTMSAGEKIFCLYQEYENELSNICGNKERIEKKDIEEFVKYRNDITHGSYRQLTLKIANTAYVMSALVYCCILKRIGFNNQEILIFCKDKLLR